jgi:acetyltransferase
VPLSEAEARDLLSRLKGARLLEGYRARPAADIDALVNLMVRLAAFASDQADEIAEIDLNPVLVHARGKGVSVVDALIVKRTR